MKLSELNPKLLTNNWLRFDCPTCTGDNAHALRIPLAPASDSKDQSWQHTGEFPDTLTCTPSVNAGCWHGWITNGEVAMPFLARSPESFLGQSVGSGQCVAFVEASTGCPPTSHWVRGRAVRNDPTIPYGSAIATFSPEGLYTNSTDGSSHAAIYLGQDAKGLRVLDQWSGQPVHARTIRFPGPSAPPPTPANSANCFFLIELASPPPSPVK